MSDAGTSCLASQAKCLSPLDSPCCPKKQIRHVVVLAISVGTSCLPDSLSPPSQQVPAGFCFLSSYDCLSSKQAQSEDAEPKGLLKLGLIFGPVCKSFLGTAMPDTQTGKNQGLQVLSAAMFVSLFAKSFGAAVCLPGQTSSAWVWITEPL